MSAGDPVSAPALSSELRAQNSLSASAPPRRAALDLTDLGLAAIALIWGINFIFLKWLLAEFEPLAFTLVRFLAIMAIAFAVLVARERDWWRVRLADLPLFILSGLFGYTFYQSLFVFGLQRTTAFSSALLMATLPIFSAIYLVALRMERVGPRQWLGIGVAFVGIVLFVSEKLQGSGLSAAGWGDLLTLAGAAAYAGYGIANKPLLTRYSVAKVMAWSLLFGVLALLPIGTGAALAQDWGRISPWNWGVFAFSVIFPIYIAYTLWNWAIRRRGVAATSLVAYVVPLLSGVFAWLLQGEAFGPLKLVGTAIVLGGLLLARR